MKVDIHTNLEWFPTSRSSDTRIYASVDDTAEFLKSNGITVNFCLYPRDQYYRLEELRDKTPDIEHIGVQVLMGADAEDATDMSKVKLDVCDPSKSFTNGGMCYGIKIASHRGWWVRADGPNSGFDYGKGDSRQLTKWLNQMPDNAICSMHMQGDPIQNSASMPYTVGMYAYKHPRLKFIINHAGDFGQGGLSNKPKKYMTVTKQGEENLFPAFRYAHSQGLISTAVFMANNLHNVLLDTSVHTPFKGKAMKNCKRWAIGSDYPFQVKDGGQASSRLFINEEKKFINSINEEAVQKCHENAYKWLKADYRDLIQEQENAW